MTTHLSPTWFAVNFEPTAQKKILLKILLLIDSAPGHPGALMETNKEIYVVFMPAKTSIL